MSKKFVLSTDPLTAQQEQALRDKLTNMGFWHWLPNFWLLKSFDETMSAIKIQTMFTEIAPLARCLVVEVIPTGTWSARARPDAQGNDMVTWLRSNWDTP